MSAWKRRATIAVIFAWSAGFVLIGATLTVSHFYSLPRPKVDQPSHMAALASLRGESETGQWMLIHVLYAECRCSQRIFDYLMSSDRPGRTAEKILMIGDGEDLRGRARAAGFDITVASREATRARFGFSAAPVLLIVDPSDRIRYSGGYTLHKQGFDVQDRDVLTGLQSGEPVEELPLYGCAVAKDLQEMLDPLGIKYAN